MGFKSNAPKKESKPAPRVKRKFPKKPKTCSQIHRGVCAVHDRPCRILVAFPEKDERNQWRDRIASMGAGVHGPESEHRCDECERDRQENSPWKDLEVEGLDAAQQARLRREAEEWTHRFTRKS